MFCTPVDTPLKKKGVLQSIGSSRAWRRRGVALLHQARLIEFLEFVFSLAEPPRSSRLLVYVISIVLTSDLDFYFIAKRPRLTRPLEEANASLMKGLVLGFSPVLKVCLQAD